MKKQVFIFLGMFLITALTWVSCAPEGEPTKPYYNSYGTVSTTDNFNFTVILDNGARLVPKELTIEDIKNDARVLLGFYIESHDSIDNEHIINAEVIEMYNVYTAEIIQLTEDFADSVGTDGVIVSEESIWLSQKHLNVPFAFYGGAELHDIHLVKPIDDQLDEEGNQILELRHNANNDSKDEYLSVTTAFYMESLYEEGMDSINFVFRSYDYDSVLTEKKDTYYFKNHTPALQSIKRGEIDFDPNYSYRLIRH